MTAPGSVRRPGAPADADAQPAGQAPERPVLRVVGARKRFDRIEALAGVDLELRRGELVALLGPNGAGKSTLVRAIAGRLRLDGGELYLHGEPLAGGAPRPRLGLVPQHIALYPMLTARENLAAFADLHRVPAPRAAAAIADALRWSGLGERADEPVERFSGGMQRRLNVACGLLHRPTLVVLDEPTVGVDPHSRQRIWDRLEALRARGAALLLTTHQLDEAQQLSDRIVIIDHGAVIAAGSAEALIAGSVGSARRLTIRLDDADAAALPERAGLVRGFERLDDGRLRCRIDDAAAELPALLTRFAAAGVAVRDLHLEAPTLQAAFLQLTGRELRD